MMTIRRLTANDYDELLSLLNATFANKNKVETHFDKDLPIMWKRDDEHMGKHFAVFEDDRMVAALGVYPLPVNILGESLLFSTVGNVATHPDFEGKGYMKALMKEAMAELDRIGADASRLGGLRARYARYGYEMCGTRYRLLFSPHNLKNYYPDFVRSLTFERISDDDYDTLEYCCTLYEKQPFYVLRGREDSYRRTYMSMVAWQNVPYIIRKDGKNVGFLSMKDDEIAEIFTETPEIFKEAILSLTDLRNTPTNFYLRPHNVLELREFSRTAESITVMSPSRFKIINYKKLINALLKLKATIHPLTNADFTLEIENYGRLRIVSDKDGTRCEDYDGECDIRLSENRIAQLLFGPLPDYAVADISEKTGNLLPLPLSWNPQDRV